MRRIAILLACLCAAPGAHGEDVDLQVINRIKHEAFQNSRVMDHVHLLTDLNGSRLAASPGYGRAAGAVISSMQALGIDAEIENAGEFGRSWSYSNINVRMLSPVETPLNGVPMAWSRGTGGPVRGSAVAAPLFENPQDPARYDLQEVAQRIEDYKQRYAGKLAGRFVLIDVPRKFKLPEEAVAIRMDDEMLGELYSAPAPGLYDPLTWPVWQRPLDEEERERQWAATPMEMKSEFWDRELAIMSRLYGFLADEGVAAILKVDDRGDGGGRLRGVYLQSNDMARPVFEAWLGPFADYGVTTITIRDTFGTDHLSFDAVGLPGFQFVQDPLEYDTRTHHSDLDTVDHLVPGDLMQAAAVLATVVYHAANRPDLMPRKSLPAPLPAKSPIPEILEY